MWSCIPGPWATRISEKTEKDTEERPAGRSFLLQGAVIRRRGPCGGSAPIFFCLDKRLRPQARAGGQPPLAAALGPEANGRGRSKENRWDERAARTGRPFVSAGVVRIGLAFVDSPSSLRRGGAGEELHPRITGLGGWTGWWTYLALFSFRAFRFTRKGYAASVNRRSRRRLCRCNMLLR